MCQRIYTFRLSVQSDLQTLVISRERSYLPGIQRENMVDDSFLQRFQLITVSIVIRMVAGTHRCLGLEVHVFNSVRDVVKKNSPPQVGFKRQHSPSIPSEE